MSALLVYKNESSEALAWSADYKARSRQVVAERAAWMDAIYEAHGIPDVEDEKVRGAFVRGEAFSGIAWPEDQSLPPGWYRPVASPELIRPRSGSRAAREISRFDYPNMRRELRENLGMPSHVFVGLRMCQPGIRLEDDAVWVTWGTRDVEDDLIGVAEHGWVRVPLVEFIARFGEDAL